MLLSAFINTVPRSLFVELAQLQSQSPLCLLQAEPSPYFNVVAHGGFGLLRGPSTSAEGPRVGSRGLPVATVDIASLLKGSGSNESTISPTRQLRPASVPPSTLPPQSPYERAPTHVMQPMNQTLMPSTRRSMTPHVPDQPVKKQSKWSPEEDALIIELRGSGMKWEDVSKRLPGRSAISCRLHYQNYLERRSEWDEERKNKLARLYERFKADMWAKVAEELAVPWRAAEAMHWQLGEADMARRAGVVPFSLAAVNVEATGRGLPPRGHAQTQSQDSGLRDMRPSPPRNAYGRGQPISTMPQGRGNRRNTTHPHPPPPPQQQQILHPQSQSQSAPPHPQPPAQTPGPHPIPPHPEFRHSPGPGLAPIQHQPHGRNPGPLPSVAQLTTGMGPFGPPSGPPTPGALPSINNPGGPLPPRYPTLEPIGSKRRASPDMSQRDGGPKRRM
ncbi:hypothetical protein PT974_02354 [Cladobotryum mycophilum]|uniref:MYB transcription factor n=1 Tax=Cladobotryum mycophilum TaxID=491253 RepID=A0ABR0SZ09_9HYPO